MTEGAAVQSLLSWVRAREGKPAEQIQSHKPPDQALILERLCLRCTALASGLDITSHSTLIRVSNLTLHEHQHFPCVPHPPGQNKTYSETARVPLHSNQGLHT